ncbi:hypothetical protein BBK14_24210 [Parafrankia soli]|uniref:Integral membrane protein n=1 Tax=Parafrankia soli TaxID=2599596 RepID=A0A1S1PR89_9ACTN|nr:hypothetical protein [Parafrankia soli]OHV23232.1 hypothetical protein BBK14_24210 [Parafrankia soli]
MWAALSRGYERVIVEPGKQPLLALLVAFILTFLFIRLSVRMIRAGVRWWPGNVAVGGVHVHHAIFGIAFVLLAGVGAFSPAGGRSPWWDLLAILFGVGAALILDEFALVLRLKDVYWSEQGRMSVDAVILGAAFTALLIVGATPLGVDGLDTGDHLALWDLIIVLGINIVAVSCSFLKGRVGFGVVGLLIPLVAVVGAVRLARPGSAWAHRRYPEGSRKAERAARRAARFAARWRPRRDRLFDLIAGRPDDETDHAGRGDSGRGSQRRR